MSLREDIAVVVRMYLEDRAGPKQLTVGAYHRLLESIYRQHGRGNMADSMATWAAQAERQEAAGQSVSFPPLQAAGDRIVEDSYRTRPLKVPTMDGRYMAPE